MNKGELIDAVAGAAGLSRADATKAVDAVLDSITGTLSNGCCGSVHPQPAAMLIPTARNTVKYPLTTRVSAC